MDNALGLVTVTGGLILRGVLFPARGGAEPPDGLPAPPADLGVEVALAPGGSAENGLIIGLSVARDDCDGPREGTDGAGEADLGAGAGGADLIAGAETEGAAFGVVLGRIEDPPPLVGGRTKVERLEPLGAAGAY